MNVVGYKKSRLLSLMLLGLMLSGTSCVFKKATVLPSPNVIHRVAEDGELTIYVRVDEKSYIKQRVRIVEGSWVAAPNVIGGR
jgi:hypothetical protein